MTKLFANVKWAKYRDKIIRFKAEFFMPDSMYASFQKKDFMNLGLKSFIDLKKNLFV